MSKSDNQSESQGIGCLEAIDSLYAYLDGELDDSLSIADVEKHISHCQHCYSRAEMEKILTDRIRKSARDSQPGDAPEALRKRLHLLMRHL
jgi:anti-sigma factor (TIGR02949 family)